MYITKTGGNYEADKYMYKCIINVNYDADSTYTNVL